MMNFPLQKIYPILIPVSRNKVSPDTDYLLGWNEVAAGNSVSEESLLHRNRISSSTLQSLPMRKSPLYFWLLFYIIWMT